MMIGEVTPILFVGLGGAGARIVGRIAKMVRGKWDEERYRDLAKFVVIDTDASVAKAIRRGREGFGPIDETFIVSDFDKQQYATLRRGEGFEIGDPYFNQWVHPDYTFRGGDTAGAGQIRIESRLGLYHAQETSDIANRMINILDQLRHHLHTGADVDTSAQAHIFFSVAGGTGSGTFLPFAYFLKSLAKGRLPLKSYGYAVQPHVFQEVTGSNFESVCANSYAALKELEFFNKLGIQTKDEPKDVEFHYDVAARIGDEPKVNSTPFEFTYIVDVPEHFYTEKILHAVADNVYFQIYSPFGEAQKSDVDNYVKNSRALYPADLAEATGKGYSVFYGSFGMGVLLVPDDDILRYCTLRFASDAVRAYLLMNDPLLVPPERREEFNRFMVSHDELRSLNPEAQKRRLDRVFVQKMELMASAFEEQPETFWGNLNNVTEGLASRFDEALDSLVEDVVTGIREPLPTLSSEFITGRTWTGDNAQQNLRIKLRAARDSIEAGLDEKEGRLHYDWWPTFLAEAGPESAKSLNPYEQRYVLLALRGQCRALIGDQAPLSDDAVNRAVEEQAIAQSAWSEAAEKDLTKALEQRAEEIGNTSPDSLWERSFGKKRCDEEFAEARKKAAKTYNKHVEGLRSAMTSYIKARLTRVLRNSSEKVLDTFRNIDLTGVRAARDLANKAETYRLSGELEETHPDGRRESHFSEANQYVVDEEVLLGPTHERLWDWYYEDQIVPLIKGPKQMEAVQEALEEGLKPKYNEQGLVIPRSGERVIRDIVYAIRKNTEILLGEKIKGPDGKGGLLLEEALLLESLYMNLRDAPEGRAERRKALSQYSGGGESVDASKLWDHPKIGNHVQAYLGEKVARTAQYKAKILSDMNRENLSNISFTDKTLVGAHEMYQGTSRLGKVLGKIVDPDNVMEDWYDAKRIVFYHYVAGVPLYVFQRVTGELQSAYREHQGMERKYWYLHCEKDFEGLEDLDPQDIKDELYERKMLRHAFFFISGRLDFEEEGGVVLVSKDDDDVTLLASSLGKLDSELQSLKGNRPEYYQHLLGEQEQQVAKNIQKRKIDQATRTSVEEYAKGLREKLIKLEELQDEISPSLLADLREVLKYARKIMDFKSVKSLGLRKV